MEFRHAYRRKSRNLLSHLKMLCFTPYETNNISQGPANIHMKHSIAKSLALKILLYQFILLVEFTDMITFHE